MRVLLLGGGGQVARAVAAVAPTKFSVIVKARRDLDITDEGALSGALKDSGAKWVVNCAAYTAVDLAETDRDAARAVNETAVGTLARASVRAGCRLLHLSTDFVFDGKANRAYLPSDPANPLSV